MPDIQYFFEGCQPTTWSFLFPYVYNMGPNYSASAWLQSPQSCCSAVTQSMYVFALCCTVTALRQLCLLAASFHWGHSQGHVSLLMCGTGCTGKELEQQRMIVLILKTTDCVQTKSNSQDSFTLSASKSLKCFGPPVTLKHVHFIMVIVFIVGSVIDCCEKVYIVFNCSLSSCSSIIGRNLVNTLYIADLLLFEPNIVVIQDSSI